MTRGKSAGDLKGSDGEKSFLIFENASECVRFLLVLIIRRKSEEGSDVCGDSSRKRQETEHPLPSLSSRRPLSLSEKAAGPGVRNAHRFFGTASEARLSGCGVYVGNPSQATYTHHL